jgi:hypothetical protein
LESIVQPGQPRDVTRLSLAGLLRVTASMTGRRLAELVDEVATLEVDSESVEHLSCILTLRGVIRKEFGQFHGGDRVAE